MSKKSKPPDISTNDALNDTEKQENSKADTTENQIPRVNENEEDEATDNEPDPPADFPIQ